MKTATRKTSSKSAGTNGGKTAAASKTMKDNAKAPAGDRKLAEVAASLKGHLKELDKEYSRLSAELEKKRQHRAELQAKRAKQPGWTDEMVRRRAARLQRNIEKSGAYVQKQTAFLKKVKAFHERNERLLVAIAERLAMVEQELNNGENTTPDARAKFQQELMGMLGELQQMRKKREELSTSITKG